MTFTRMLAALACSAALGQPALADGYPSKPITLVIGSSAGSTTDGLARALGPEIPAATTLHELKIPIPGPGRYLLQIHDAKRGLTLQLPTNIPLVIHGLVSLDLSPQLFFYVPKESKKLAFIMPSAAPVKIRDSRGELVPVQRGGITMIPVPDGQDGQIWSIQGYKAFEGFLASRTVRELIRRSR